MQMMPSLQVKQKQALVMTPQLQQAIKLLQMTNLDICNYLQDQALENPFLEVENGPSHETASDLGSTSRDAATSDTMETGALDKGLDKDMAGGAALADDPTANTILKTVLDRRGWTLVILSAVAPPILIGTRSPIWPNRSRKALSNAFFGRSI